MKVLLKLALSAFLLFILLIVGIAGWFFFYQGDVPDERLLAQFAPDVSGVASGPCLSRPIAVVPDRQIAKDMREAIKAAESDTIRPFQLARFVLCAQRRSNLSYAVDQYRLAWRIRSRFSKEQMLTIYANSVYFGDDTFGVGDGSERFFGKEPNNLSIAEAALLAGVIRNPGQFSPYKHPDEALQRRNAVIEAMRARGVVSRGDASTAEAAPLGVLSNPTR